jgi:O-antigen/teichoic acid export membrane protein
MTAGEPGRARAVLQVASIVNVLGGLLASAILIGAAGPIGSRFDLHGETAALRIYALVAPFTALTVATSAALRVLGRFRGLAGLTVVQAVLRLAVVVVAISLGWDLVELVTALVVAEAAGAFAMLALAESAIHRELPVRSGFRERMHELRPEMRRMVSFLGISNVQGTLKLATTQLDVLLVGGLGGAAAAGTYKLAKSFALPLTFVPTPYYQAIYPQLTREFELGDFGAIARTVRQMTRVMTVVLVPMAAVIAIAAPLLMPLLGKGYGGAGGTTALLSAGLVVAGVFFWAHALALSMDMQLFSLRASAISIGCEIFLLIVLVPRLGDLGAALSYFIFTLIWAAVLVPPLVRRVRAGRIAAAAATPA